MRKGRAIFVALLAWQISVGTASGAPRTQTDKTKDVAQGVYVEGVDHYRAGRLLEALAAFRASYEMVPSPNSHLMIARTLREKGQLVDAYVEYDKLVTEADAAAERDSKYDGAARAARAERSKLRSRITMLTVRVLEAPAGLQVTVGDRQIPEEDWGRTVPVASGVGVARAAASGRTEQRHDLTLIPGEELVVSFDFSPPARSEVVAVEPTGDAEHPSESPFPADTIPDIPHQSEGLPRRAPDRTWAYVSFGVGGAGLATFVAFGVINQSMFGDLQRACPGGHCAASRADDVERGRRAQLIANIGFGTALAASALGFVLLANENAVSSEKPQESARRARKLAVTDISFDLQAVQVRGIF